MKKTRIACALITALGFGASACGGGDSADAELEAAMVAEWTADGDFPEGIDLECAAKGLLGGVGGAEGAATYGVTPENVGSNGFDEVPMSEEHARASAKGMIACDGFNEAMSGVFTEDLADEQATCLSDAITDERLESFLASAFMGDAGAELGLEFQTDLGSMFEECGVS